MLLVVGRLVVAPSPDLLVLEGLLQRLVLPFLPLGVIGAAGGLFVVFGIVGVVAVEAEDEIVVV